MKICIRTLGAGVLTLTVEATDTINSITERIQNDVKINAQHLQIFFNNKLHDKHLTLTECGIEDENTVILVHPKRIPPFEENNQTLDKKDQYDDDNQIKA